MLDFSPEEHRNIKALIVTFEEMDGLVIDASGERSHKPRDRVPFTESYLSTLEDSRQRYRDSDYQMTDMLQFLEDTSRFKPFWHSTLVLMISCSYACMGTSVGKSICKFRLTQILKVADRAWRLVVPCTNTMTGGADTINSIVDKFVVLDDALEQLLPLLEMDSQIPRSSDELRDTLHALIVISQASGNSPYQPTPTTQQIDLIKSEIRQRRRVQSTDASTNEPQPVANPPSPPPTLPPNTSLHNWNPTITAFVTIITMLSAIPGYKAWQYSPHAPGTVQDADFWILVQGSMMQLLGLLTIIFPLMSSSISPTRTLPWFWTWGFVVTSLLCSVSAVPFYLHFPTEWSQLIAFLGSAAQAFVTLQAMFTIGRSSSKAVKYQ